MRCQPLTKVGALSIYATNREPFTQDVDAVEAQAVLATHQEAEFRGIGR